MAVDAPRIVIVVVLLLFLFLSPDTRTPSVSQQLELEAQIRSERHALDVLVSSSFGDLDPVDHKTLNLTGFNRDANLAWNVLPEVQRRAKEQIQAIFAASPLAMKLGNDSTIDEVLHNSLESMNPFKDPVPLFQNLTGMVNGHWTRSKVSEGIPPPLFNVSALAPAVDYTSLDYKRNVTGKSGDLRIKMDEIRSQELEDSPGMIREIKAEVIIKDESSGDEYGFNVHGVHFPRAGGIVLTTTSEKFMGIFALPHLCLSQEGYRLSQALLNRTLSSGIDEQESSPYGAFNPWATSPNNPSESLFPIPHCEFVLYLQQHPSDDSGIPFERIESELRFSDGAPVPSAPHIRMSALIFSPDCGFVLESVGPPDFPPQDGLHLSGRKLEVYLKLARFTILAFALLVSAEILLLKGQMNEANTPSTRGRISFYSIAMMAFGDGFACMALMVAGMFIDALFLALMTTAFLSFLCVSFFGMKFLMDIWSVQAPERQERERQRQRARDRRDAEGTSRQAANASNANTTGPTSPIITAAGADVLPLPATAQRRPTDNGAMPVIIPSDQDVEADATENENTTTQPTTLGSARREMGALYSKFYFLLLTILFLSLHATTWPPMLRSAYSNSLAFAYLSFWVPQIYRNIMRNCRKALHWQFVIGESCLRVIPFVYFYTYKDNVLYVENSYNACYVLVGWLWIQVWILISQEILGPRFFVPEGWAPTAYDYHPLLRDNGNGEAGSNMPVGFTEAIASPSSPIAEFALPIATSSFPTALRPPSQTRDKTKRTFDCAICILNFDVPIVPSPAIASIEEIHTALAAITVFSRRAYMVTPCRHIFHSACLEGWMRYRLQCPICRENLPPL